MALNVGDILVGIGGYNRTIAKFYKVTRQTEKSIWLVELEKIASTRHWEPIWTVMPVDKPRGKEFRKTKKHSVDVDGFYLSRWDGKPVTETSD